MINLEKIIEASERIDVARTPVLTSSILDAMASQMSPLELFFKCELFQKTGSFKFRGAANAVALLSEEEAEKGIVAHSAGNHAGSCALAAKKRGIPAYIIVPETTPQVKKDAVRGYGATLIECEPPFEARERMAQKIKQETGASFIHPFDNMNVMAGQGTIALELLSQVTELDALIIPVGGGGLLTGCTVAARGLNPAIKVFAAEPELVNDCYRSFHEKRRVNNSENGTLSVADGLLTNLGELALSQLDNIDDIFTVSEQEIVTAMKLVWERMKLCIEPSAAVALAVALYNKQFQSIAKEQGIKRIGIIFSGGNVDITAAIDLFNRFKV
ncbi:tryptophan synthase beta subunit-like PLP-dependent enzyme, partial [Backusella circina FSU 941]